MIYRVTYATSASARTAWNRPAAAAFGGGQDLDGAVLEGRDGRTQGWSGRTSGRKGGAEVTETPEGVVREADGSGWWASTPVWGLAQAGLCYACASATTPSAAARSRGRSRPRRGRVAPSRRPGNRHTRAVPGRRGDAPTTPGNRGVGPAGPTLVVSSDYSHPSREILFITMQSGAISSVSRSYSQMTRPETPGPAPRGSNTTPSTASTRHRPPGGVGPGGTA